MYELGGETVRLNVIDGTGYRPSGTAYAVCTIADEDFPPGSFALLNPANGRNDVGVKVPEKFEWQASEYAEWYTLRVVLNTDDIDNPSSPVIDDVRIDAGGLLEYTPSAGVLAYSEDYVWRVTAWNAVDSTDSNQDFTFRTELDTYGPEVVGRSPHPGEDEVKVSTDIRIVFDEPITASLLQDAVTVEAGGDRVGGAVRTEGDNVLVFTPETDLKYETEYKVTAVAACIEDRVVPTGMATDDTFWFTMKASCRASPRARGASPPAARRPVAGPTPAR